jgi:hypothetical protein
MNEFLRTLMLEANNYHATYGNPPSIRNVYVSMHFYKRMCNYFGTKGDKCQGYNVMVVLNDAHPDYVICLR